MVGWLGCLGEAVGYPGAWVAAVGDAWVRWEGWSGWSGWFGWVRGCFGV